MMTWLREKFGGIIVAGIMGLLAFVFVFSGILTPRATRGLHEGSVAGKVNGDSITLDEFNRALKQKTEMFKAMMGGKVSDEQLQAFRIKEMVFRELVQRRLMIQEAFRLGLAASDEEVRDQIQTIPAFQKDGHFDLMQYKEVLAANQYSPGSFERSLREDLSSQRWGDYFARRVHVSDDEARKDFLLSRDRRNIKYVILTNENGRRGVDIKADEIQKFLADPGKMNLAKSQYEAKKETEYKGKSFDAAKNDIAHSILASEKLPEIQKVNEKVATQIVDLMKADKGSDAKVNAILKPYGAEVKTTGFVSRENQFFPGIGEAKELSADAFAEKSPIDPKEGGKAKRYPSAAWQLVAVISDSEKADLAKFDAQREDVMRNLAVKKQRALFEDWLKGLMSKAKIDPNSSVIGTSDGG